MSWRVRYALAGVEIGLGISQQYSDGRLAIKARTGEQGVSVVVCGNDVDGADFG